MTTSANDLLAEYAYPDHPVVRDFFPPIEDDEEAHRLEAELRAELAPSHPLFGCPARVLGKGGTDDTLFVMRIHDQLRLVEVHLTYGAHPDLPGHPSFEIYENLDALVSAQERWRVD